MYESTRKKNNLGFLTSLMASGVVALSLTAYPLLGTPGPECATLYAFLFSPILLFIGNAIGSQRDDRGFGLDFRKLLLHLTSILVPLLAITSINAIWTFSCADNRGIIPILLLGIPPLLFSGTAGLFIGRIVGSKWPSVILSAFFYGGYLLSLALLWWSHPTFYFLSHFSGIISGDMLHGFQLSPGFWAYRLSTLIMAAGLGLAGFLFFPNVERKGLVSRAGINAWIFLLSITLFGTGVGASIRAANDIAPSRFKLKNTYSYISDAGSVLIHANPNLTSKHEVDAVAREANLWMKRIETRTGIISARPIHIYLHPNSAEQYRFTGARHVHFAFPSKRTVHVVGSDTPHPTLGHELAHVVLGQLAHTFWGTPGKWGMPNVGLTEALATALTQELNVLDDLSVEEQAAALLVQPSSGLSREAKDGRIEKIFSSLPWRNWETSPKHAYTLGAAYILHLLSSKQKSEHPKLWQHMARAQDMGDLIGEPSKSYAQFVKAAATKHLPTYAQATVDAYYRSNSILTAKCDAKFDGDLQNIRQLANQEKWDDAEKIASDNSKSKLLFESLYVEAIDKQNFEKAKIYLEKSFEANDPTHAKTAWDDKQAELLWLTGRYSDARKLWRDINVQQLPPYKQREIDAKRIFSEFALDSVGKLRTLSFASINLLIHADVTQNSPSKYADIAQKLAVINPDKLEMKQIEPWMMSHYLLARFQSQNGSLKLAQWHLDHIEEARSLNKLATSFSNESIQIKARALLERGRPVDAALALKSQTGLSSQGAQLAAADALERMGK